MEPKEAVGKKRGRKPGRPLESDPEATRQAILQHARQSFAAVGFEGAGIREIAEKAGVNAATVHYHFGSKEELYKRIVSEAAELLFKRVEAAATMEGTAVQKLHTVLHAYAEVLSAYPHLPRIVFHAVTGARLPTHEWLLENYASKGARILPTILMEGMMSGELRRMDPRFTTMAVVSLAFFFHLAFPGLRRLLLQAEGVPAPENLTGAMPSPPLELSQAYAEHTFQLLMQGLLTPKNQEETRP